MSENENNVKDFKIKLYNILIQYYNKNKNKNKNKRVTSIRVDPQIYENFLKVSMKFGVMPHRGISDFLAGIMEMLHDTYKDSPQIVQATLFYKPHIEKVEVKQQFNIAQKLELKLVKQDLTTILNGLEQKRGDPAFLLGRLREVLPKAIRLYQKTSNAEIAELLEKTEKWI